jgi:hypothetical protein
MNSVEKMRSVFLVSTGETIQKPLYIADEVRTATHLRAKKCKRRSLDQHHKVSSVQLSQRTNVNQCIKNNTLVS